MFRIVRRRNGESVRIPVDEDGYVPYEELVARNAKRSARARTVDAQKTSKKVLVPPVTPEDAVGWWVNPGKSDIAGIDAPAARPRTVMKPGNGKGTRTAQRRTAKAPPPPQEDREPPIWWLEDWYLEGLEAPSDAGGFRQRHYAVIDEDLARAAHENIGWGSFEGGWETQRYRERADAVYDLADDVKDRTSQRNWAKIDELARRYADDLAAWINESNAVRAGRRTSAITSPSGFNRPKGDRFDGRTMAEELDRIESIPYAIEGYALAASGSRRSSASKRRGRRKVPREVDRRTGGRHVQKRTQKERGIGIGALSLLRQEIGGFPGCGVPHPSRWQHGIHRRDGRPRTPREGHHSGGALLRSGRDHGRR